MKAGYGICAFTTLMWFLLSPGGLVAREQAEKIDPLEKHILYGANGHFYAVYVAAQIANKGSQARYDVEAIAFYSELPDKLKATTAYYPGPPIFEAVCNLISFGYAFPYFDRVQRRLHSLSG